MNDLVFKPIKQLAKAGELQFYADGRTAVWNPERGWVPVWNGSEQVRKPR